MPRLTPIAVLLTPIVLATSTLPGSAATAGVPDSSFAQASAGGLPRVTRDDLRLLGLATAGVAFAFPNDREATSEVLESRGRRGGRNLAAAFTPLGTPAVLAPAALALYAYGRFGGRPEIAQHTIRASASVLVAVGVTSGLKEAFGRLRPYESPDASFRFRPFSGHTSFPSGHTAMAFAAAAAIDHETSSRWVPLVAYPAATLVAWSRVHDDQHWTSDVVAGAAIGGWTAWKTADWLASRESGVTRSTWLGLLPSGALGLAWRRTF